MLTERRSCQPQIKVNEEALSVVGIVDQHAAQRCCILGDMLRMEHSLRLVNMDSAKAVVLKITQLSLQLRLVRSNIQCRIFGSKTFDIA